MISVLLQRLPSHGITNAVVAFGCAVNDADKITWNTVMLLNLSAVDATCHGDLCRHSLPARIHPWPAVTGLHGYTVV